MDFKELNGDQVRQLIDAEQVFSSYAAARSRLDHSFNGSMSWKTVDGRDYLYRKRDGIWKSLGPRNADTEIIHTQFHVGRQRAKWRVQKTKLRLDETAPVHRALRLGRMPTIAARILRAMTKAGLVGSVIEVVGTNALFAYERMAGVHIAGAHLATGDIDLLFDARARLKLLAPDIAVEGLAGLLRKVDRSFTVKGRDSFRAENDDGYMVDLITPLGRDRMAERRRSRIGTDGEDLKAVEIEGLSWLVNSPKVAVTVMDERGYPLSVTVPDPRAFTLHKVWLSQRDDRDPLKRQRDDGQARLVAELLATRLPHLAFDDPALGAIPARLRAQAANLIRPAAKLGADAMMDDPGEPNW